MVQHLEDLTKDQLVALLEDTQGSLAAALARLEALRLQNKKLKDEVSLLRQQVHGRGAAAGPGPGSERSQHGSERVPSRPASLVFPQELHATGPDWTTCHGGPVYVSNLEAQAPVSILSESGRSKVPASILVTREHIDFVEVRHRARPAGFVGISSVKVPTRPADDDPPLGRTSRPPAGSGEGGTDAEDAGPSGVWTMMWSEPDGRHGQVTFEASKRTREMLHKHTERWLTGVEPEENLPDGRQDPGDLAPPRSLTVGDLTLNFTGEPSLIIGTPELRALASCIPPMERMRDWTLAYSTARHGISLGTLYRRMQQGQKTITLIKDTGGYVFGCYTPEPWHVAPRFYGSGETFVFQLAPHRVMYPWRSLSKVKNDFFQYATPECLAVGGLGHFALHVDSELLQGSSGTCGTFGSPCLASNEEFKIQVIEIWQVVSG